MLGAQTWAYTEQQEHLYTSLNIKPIPNPNKPFASPPIMTILLPSSSYSDDDIIIWTDLLLFLRWAFVCLF